MSLGPFQPLAASGKSKLHTGCCSCSMFFFHGCAQWRRSTFLTTMPLLVVSCAAEACICCCPGFLLATLCLSGLNSAVTNKCQTCCVFAFSKDTVYSHQQPDTHPSHELPHDVSTCCDHVWHQQLQMHSKARNQLKLICDNCPDATACACANLQCRML